MSDASTQKGCGYVLSALAISFILAIAFAHIIIKLERNAELRESMRGELQQRAYQQGSHDLQREAILRGVATYVVDINGVATFVWLAPLKAEK
jgi:hypothetical protein